jgi:hypothetical protein
MHKKRTQAHEKVMLLPIVFVGVGIGIGIGIGL